LALLGSWRCGSRPRRGRRLRVIIDAGRCAEYIANDELTIADWFNDATNAREIDGGSGGR